MIPSCKYFSPTGVRQKCCQKPTKDTHFGLQLLSYTILMFSFDNEVVVVQILDDKAFLLIHHEKDLLHCWVAVHHMRYSNRLRL